MSYDCVVFERKDGPLIFKGSSLSANLSDVLHCVDKWSINIETEKAFHRLYNIYCSYRVVSMRFNYLFKDLEDLSFYIADRPKLYIYTYYHWALVSSRQSIVYPKTRTQQQNPVPHDAYQNEILYTCMVQWNISLLGYVYYHKMILKVWTSCPFHHKL